MVSHWNLSDRKSPQVSRTLLSILADVNNVVVSIVSTRPLIFMSCSPYTNPLVIVPSAPITIGITVTFMFHSFIFNSKQSQGHYFTFRFLTILLCGQPAQESPQVGKFF